MANATSFRTQTMRPQRTLAALALLCALLTPAACSHQAPSGVEAVRKQAQFPVAVPFALDRAGSRVTVEFDLPDTRETGVLRPVFIGFQRFGRKRTLTDAEVKRAGEELLRLKRDPIPIRLRLEAVDAAPGMRPPVLEEMQPNPNSEGRYFYLPLQGDVATRHMATGEDSGELLHAGLYDTENYYVTREIVRIVPPTPGRYRLHVESLEDQPALRGMSFRLIVSHYYARGIR